MNRLEAALLDIVGFLDGRHIPYMVIGGFANLYWGKPRLTEDVDLKLQVPEENWDDFLASLSTRFRLLADHPREFLDRTRVVPITTPTHVRVDLVMAGFPYEEEAIRRAEIVVVGGTKVRICTPEDLILHKIISDRERDRHDVEGVIMRVGAKLNREYLEPRLTQLAAALELRDVEAFYRSCLRKAGVDR